jgi:LmbE family N-acetylglucosaminyl deacetylase
MSSRRSFVRQSLAVGASLNLTLLNASDGLSGKQQKIVCVGGHPDDPESGCGGTLAKLSREGHSVTIIYLTRGEAGIDGKTNDEAAVIRSGESISACKIIGAKPVFAGQVDGATIFNREWIGKMKELIEPEQPDILFTHWPIDSHPDHQVASLLAIQSWMRLNRSFALYFFEVCSGSQTCGFLPTDYVDISATREVKKKAVQCHSSQRPDEIYRSKECNHELMETFRGIEINVAAAEAFARMNANTTLRFP